MKKLIYSLLITALMVMALAGCGNLGNKEEKATQEVIELNVAYMPNYGSLWSVLNAIEQGYMEEEGIKVNLIEFADGPTIITAMENGSVDVGYIGQGAHKLCINGRAKIFALSHISNADMVIAGEGITSIEQLAGKKVAYVSGTSSEDILVNSLKRVNMTMNDIIAVDMSVESVVDAMKLGGADAAAIWSPYSLQILDDVNGTTKLTDNMTFSDETVSLSSWVVSPKYAEENRDILIRFTRALFRAMDYGARENHKETAALIAGLISVDENVVYEQRGDAQWLSGKEVVRGVEDGSVAGYYELQKRAFLEAGTVDSDPAVSEYVMFDIMTKAGQY